MGERVGLGRPRKGWRGSSQTKKLIANPVCIGLNSMKERKNKCLEHFRNISFSKVKKK